MHFNWGIWVALGLHLAALFGSSTVYAWGSEGHQAVALIAQSKLTPSAVTQVNNLLALEPGESLASISTWADEHKNPSTAQWHYVNFPKDSCVFIASRDCPNGKCVVSAIEQQLAVLSSKTDDHSKLIALKYLVHLVADVHQPLHAGYAEDRGGNTYQLRAFMRGSNLHSFWDSGLIKFRDEDVAQMAKRLAVPLKGKTASDLSPITAAEESCSIVSLPGFYPDRKVSQNYVERFVPVMERRIQTAGERLAGMLNSLFK